MDEQLRDLERRASAGDEVARRALGQEWRRRGLGWHGEDLFGRTRTAQDFPLYVFDTRRSFSIEMLRLPAAGIWIARWPTRWLDYERWRHLIDGSTRTRRGTTSFGSADDDPVADREWGKAAAFCQWIGCRLPRRRELEEAFTSLVRDGLALRDGLAEWCDDGEPEGQLTPLRAHVVRPRGTSSLEPIVSRRGDLGFRPVFPTGRDIDLVIDAVVARVPGVMWHRLRVSHPGADDDGLWTFWHDRRHVQVESSSGMTPFLVEADHREPFEGRTIDEVVRHVVAWLAP